MGLFVAGEWTAVVVPGGFVVSGFFVLSGAGRAVLDGLAVWGGLQGGESWGGGG